MDRCVDDTWLAASPGVGRLIQLQQVIINLPVNSVQSITQRKCRIDIEASLDEEAGRRFFFGNGLGIPSTNLDPSLTAASGPRKRI